MRRLPGAIGVAGAVLLALGSAASAQTATVRDGAHDTMPNDLSTADVRSATATYGHGRLTVTVHVPDLPPSEGHLEVYVDRPGDSIYPYIRRLDVQQTTRKTKAALIEYYDYEGEDHKLPCKVRAAWSTEKHQVTVSAPKSCIGWRSVKVHVVMQALGETDAGNEYSIDQVKQMTLTYG